MEENYLLAKQTVDEKFDSTNKYYYMYICALFGFFMKYPDNKDLVIDAFKKTKIIIEDKTIIEIQNDYGLNLLSEEELAVQDASVCINHAISDIGFSHYIEDGKLQTIHTAPLIVCSTFNISDETLLNSFVHELNHIIKGSINSFGSKSDDTVSTCYNRTGLSYTIFSYDKSADTLTETEFYSILEELINVFQTTEVLGYILMLDGIVPDENFQKYFDKLNKDEMKKNNGYEKCSELFHRVWENDVLKNILEKHLIDGQLTEVSNEFNDAVGMECFDTLADWFDDLDYLFCLNARRKDFNRCYKALDKLIKNITSHKIKK